MHYDLLLFQKLCDFQKTHFGFHSKLDFSKYWFKTHLTFFESIFTQSMLEKLLKKFYIKNFIFHK